MDISSPTRASLPRSGPSPDLSADHVMLLGTGAAALAALWNLAAAGAHVRWYVDRADVGAETLLASGLSHRLAGGLTRGGLQLSFDDPRNAPLGGAVVAARGDDLDCEIAERARASAVPVHVVGRPDLSSVAFADVGTANGGWESTAARLFTKIA